MFFIGLKRRHYKRKKRISAAKYLSPLVTFSVALIVGGCLISFIEERIGESVANLAQVQAEHQVRLLVEEEITELLNEYNIKYGSFITIERDDAGKINALVSNTAQLNSFRSQLTQRLWRELNENRACAINIPLGNLLQSELTWGRGPTFSIKITAISKVSATFQSEFIESGVNQTLHKIDLQIVVPIALMLPDKPVELLADIQLPVAETVIVGQIPHTYFQYSELPAVG